MSTDAKRCLLTVLLSETFTSVVSPFTLHAVDICGCDTSEHTDLRVALKHQKESADANAIGITRMLSQT